MFYFENTKCHNCFNTGETLMRLLGEIAHLKHKLLVQFSLNS